MKMIQEDFRKKFPDSPFAYRLHNFVFLFDKIFFGVERISNFELF
jgi:hypothetical protein